MKLLLFGDRDPSCMVVCNRFSSAPYQLLVLQTKEIFMHIKYEIFPYLVS